ncbi:unnamed protein product, partial [Mesorhabditis belari]|uniref:Uncharacterized protein n=1 Tax=Mesorhabditis belari TaxID=2138241 RepID=A0AAF3JAF4_9BILA
MSAHQVEQILKNTGAKYIDSAKKDIMGALGEFRDLAPEMENFMFPDGKRRQALKLKGTIPVHYKGSVYNIPVSVYLWETHPYYAPVCFVNPTNSMVIRESENVNKQGRVFLPYLKEWRFPGYDLNGLIQVMAMVFQEKCPVFAKPAGPTSQPSSAPQTPQPTSTPYPNATTIPYPTTASGGMPPYPMTSTSTPYPQGGIQYPAYPGYPGYPNYQNYNNAPTNNRTPPPVPPPPSSIPSSIGNDHIKNSLITALQDKFRNKLRDRLGTSQAELASIRETQSDLQKGQAKLKAIGEELEKQQTQLDQFIFAYHEKKTELEKALHEMGASNEGPPVDEAIEAATPLHRQLLEHYAADLACDDAVYSLGKALQHQKLSTSDYIKQVRNVYRQRQLASQFNEVCSNRLPGHTTSQLVDQYFFSVHDFSHFFC